LCQQYVLARETCWVPEGSLPAVLFGHPSNSGGDVAMSE
jgi:hypothetical protein